MNKLSLCYHLIILLFWPFPLFSKQEPTATDSQAVVEVEQEQGMDLSVKPKVTPEPQGQGQVTVPAAPAGRSSKKDDRKIKCEVRLSAVYLK